MKRLLLSMAVLFASLTGFSQTDPGVDVVVNNYTSCNLAIQLVSFDGCAPSTGAVYHIPTGSTAIIATSLTAHFEFATLYGLTGGTLLVYYLDIQTPTGVIGWSGTPCIPPVLPTTSPFYSCGMGYTIEWVGTSAAPEINIY